LYAILISAGDGTVLISQQGLKLKKQIWQTFSEPRLVDAFIRFVPNKESHERVSCIILNDWFGKEIELPHIHLYHKSKRGLRTYHIYSCTDKEREIFFRILFCPQTQRVSVLGVCGPYIDSYS
jgi:hypothetical protein